MQISFHQDWSEWFRGRFNWRNFTFVELSMEKTTPHHLGFHELEIMAGLLGFNVWLEFSWGSEEQHAKMREQRRG